MKLEKFFRQKPVFTNNEFAEFQGSRGPLRARAPESLLAYHTKTGRLLRVRRGLYAVVPVGANPETYPFDPFLLAAKMVEDAVLAYHTALDFHGKAYSVQSQFTYLTRRAPRSLTFRTFNFRPVLFPKALRAKGKENFEVMMAERSGVEVRVTSLERTMVDVLDRPDLSGSWEEIWRSLESVEFFDLDKVVEYTLLLDNATTAAKVGFFLDQHRETLMVENSHLRRVREFRPRQPHYLERSRRKAGRLVPDWNLVVPPVVLERSWAEVT